MKGYFRSTGDEEIRYELEKYFDSPYFVPKPVSEFDDEEEEEEEERFLAWIFMGAPGPGASLHVSIASKIVHIWRRNYSFANALLSVKFVKYKSLVNLYK